MKYLLVEDDEEKCEKIADFLKSHYPSCIIDVAHSFNAGLRAIIRALPDTILLLDMSMPNFDSTSSDPSGGAPEHFAGRDLLAQMKLRGIKMSTIVITMFDLFGENSEKISFSQLEGQLKQEFSPQFKGMVYYSSSQESWKSSLSLLIAEAAK